jgi:hypothetical protein
MVLVVQAAVELVAAPMAQQILVAVEVVTVVMEVQV